MTVEVRKRKPLMGVVVSKMLKTLKVLVKNKYPHPVYGKYVTRARSFMAHFEEQNFAGKDIQIGNKVLIQPCAPVSKKKSWVVVDVITD